MSCETYNPDAIFKNFKLLEFPLSFVGLSTTQELDVEQDITGTSYIKTHFAGSLMTFDEAREVSPSHRAYSIKIINNHTLGITFTPSNECIAKTKLMKLTDMLNRFVFDLRVYNVEGVACCNNECHSEIARFYISGQYEYCKIAHSPTIIDFGDVAMKSKVTRSFRIRNESKSSSVLVTYAKTAGYTVTPCLFRIPPCSSKKIEISITPTSLKITTVIVLRIKNCYPSFTEPKYGEVISDENFLSYTINVRAHVFMANIKNPPTVQSLHTIYEPHFLNTFMNKELDEHMKRKEIANQFLQFSKSMHLHKKNKEALITTKIEIPAPDIPSRPARDFCKKIRLKISAPDVFNIFFEPMSVDFGNVANKTFGKQDLTIQNRTRYDIIITFKKDRIVLYTNEKLAEYVVKIKSLQRATIGILCLGRGKGFQKNTFRYVIDNKFHRDYPYSLQVNSPLITIRDNILKFGMVTTEGFVTSVPVKIYNNYNVPVDFEWGELHPEAPFEILPLNGTIPENGCRICDLMYTSKIAKIKSFDAYLISKGAVDTTIPIELNIITRKVSLKFLQPILTFKDVPLNLESTEEIRFENCSKEIALFNVMDPMIPGITIIPTNGIMRPKTVITFRVIVKIACVMEFTFDLFVKVNNKETISISVSGSVIEPKLNFSPKAAYMPRIPCGMITYVPINIQNFGSLKSKIQILDTGDENIFNVYDGYDKTKINEFYLEPGRSKLVYVKVCDVFRREYDMYIPFVINDLLGPPRLNEANSTEIKYYIGKYEQLYDDGFRVKLKSVNKDINYFRIVGVFTVPWIEISEEKFVIEYSPWEYLDNCINFTITNISKYYLHICIVTSKLAPHFSLEITTEDNESIVNESYIKFELDRTQTASFSLNFHPQGYGKTTAVALLYLDKAMLIPYSNLTFYGRREYPTLSISTPRILFPPSYVGTVQSQIIELDYESPASLNAFACSSKEEKQLRVEFLDAKEIVVDEKCHTIIRIKVSVCCHETYARTMTLVFHHDCGSTTRCEVSFCSSYCPLTLHAIALVTPETNPFPFYPLASQVELYDYLETCTAFLERWMFFQGFRRELFPTIPDTFHTIAPGMVIAHSLKNKGMGTTLLNFMKRIAGPLMKYIHKASGYPLEEPYKTVKEIHDTYASIIHLLRCRGANLWLLQAKYLLTHNQFLIYIENKRSMFTADIAFSEKLSQDIELYGRLTKQCWLDFLLQCYKVFIMDNCFFDCVCVTSEPRNIEMILVNWYNEQIRIAHHIILKDEAPKHITNITTDLKDGLALISTLYNHCSFLEDLLTMICCVDKEEPTRGIIHNACIIQEALNLLRIFFPLSSKDFLEPNFIQMLFLSIHLYVALPMFRYKDKVEFNPPLLRTASRTLAISSVNQETLTYNYVILNNHKNSFKVEKVPSEENDKKTYVNVKYTANFVSRDSAILLVHGYNKTRIFDTYMTFLLVGNIGALIPFRKNKLTATLYRPNKVDISIHSPFTSSAIYKVYVTDIEPTIPVVFESSSKKVFRFKRLKLVENEILLFGRPAEQNDVIEHKLYLQMYCLTTQTGNSWIWFRSEVGEFFIKVATQPRWDVAIDNLQVNVRSWPMQPCSCGEACECYRTAIVTIPHRNDLMIKALRTALIDQTTETMVNLFDKLIETHTGQIILKMLLVEGGTNVLEVEHILRPENTYRITSKNLVPQITQARLKQHTDAVLTVPVTVNPREKSEKFNLTLNSLCGMDIRTYKIIFIEKKLKYESFESSEARSSN